MSLVQGLRDQPGRERQERDGQQQQKVQSKKNLVDPIESVGQTVVEDPDPANSQETDEVSQVRRPATQELLQGRAWRADGNIEHEQRDSDGQDTVAERLHPALAQSCSLLRPLVLVCQGRLLKLKLTLATPVETSRGQRIACSGSECRVPGTLTCS